MGVLPQILVTMGIGAAKLELLLPQRFYPRGTEIHGSVILTGGMAAQTFPRITLRLDERAKKDDLKAYARQTLAQRITIRPHTQETFPFSVRLSDEATIYRQESMYGWEFYAEAELPLGYRPRVLRTIVVVQHREITAVQQALLTLGFSEPGFRVGLIYSGRQDNTLNKHFLAPAYAEQVRGASLTLYVVGENVVGILQLQWHAQTLAERIKSLVIAERETLDIVIPREALLKGGKPFPQGAVPYLKAVLENAHVFPDSDTHHLVRAASAPEDAATLLRPASDALTTPPELLLHPLEEETPAEEQEPSPTAPD